MEPGLLLFALLSQAPPVAALLPHVRLGQPEVKVYPVVAPENTPLPYVCYQLISRVPDGSAVCELGDAARVQLSLFAASYAQLCQLAQACRRALHGQTTPGGVTLELANEFDHPPEDRTQAYFRSQDYLCDLPPEA